MKEKITLIEYSPKVDFLNSVSHASGAVLSFPAAYFLIRKANTKAEIFAAVLYMLSFFAVFTVSAVYHGIRKPEAKRKARLLDHSTVPLLIAGTATPCALVTLHRVSEPHSIFVFALAWFCTLFGIFSKLFFFEKLKAVTMAVYIISCVLMLMAAVPLLGEINSSAFGKLIIGCGFYAVGLIFCGMGKQKEIYHFVFHLFVLLGAFMHYYIIYEYVFG